MIVFEQAAMPRPASAPGRHARELCQGDLHLRQCSHFIDSLASARELRCRDLHLRQGVLLSPGLRGQSIHELGHGAGRKVLASSDHSRLHRSWTPSICGATSSCPSCRHRALRYLSPRLLLTFRIRDASSTYLCPCSVAKCRPCSRSPGASVAGCCSASWSFARRARFTARAGCSEVRRFGGIATARQAFLSQAPAAPA